MSLSIQVRTDDGAVVVTLAGSADATLIAPLRDPLVAALADTGLLVIDLDDATGLDPVALRDVFVDVFEAVPGGELRIAGSVETVASLTEVGVDDFAGLHLTVTEALGGSEARS